MVKQTIIQKPFLDFNGRLSEGITYNPANNSLLWIDIIDRKVHRVFLPSKSAVNHTQEDLASVIKSHEVFPLAHNIGVIGLTQDPNTLISGCKKGYGFLNLKNGEFNYSNLYPHDDHKFENMRSNDGTIDNEGNFWVGTMFDFHAKADSVGKLYRINARDGSIDIMQENCFIPNGLQFSSDSKNMYWIDSLTYTLWKFDYDRNSGKLSNKEEFFNTKKAFPQYESPEPDGFVMSSDGQFFVALFSTGKVLHLDAQGNLVEEIIVPAKRVTCATIGGINNDELFITTADLHLDEPEELNSEAGDYGGAIFRLKLDGVKGVYKNIWGGRL